MIGDAYVEVTCDGLRCREALQVPLPFVYQNLAGGGGHYSHKPAAILSQVKSEGWIVVEDETDEGKHYCCEGCVPE